jgi:hypothetical protein
VHHPGEHAAGPMMLISAPVREHYHRHPYGSSIKIFDQRNHRQWIYVYIPKNASSWMRTVFGRGEPYNFYQSQSQYLTKYIVILRDPIERWLSGFAQVQHGTEPWHPTHYRNQNWNRIFSKIVFDNHTEPQASFLSGISISDVIWFEFGPNLAQDVTAWSQNHLDLEIPDLYSGIDNEYNISEFNTGKYFQNPSFPYANVLGPSAAEIIKEAKISIEENPRYLEMLKQFYKLDIDLYNSVEFYRKELQ